MCWPVDGDKDPLKIELSGLPIYDSSRAFLGYRGFGVCRDIERINQLARTRRVHPIGFMAPLLVLIGRLLQGFSAGMELGGVSVYLSRVLHGSGSPT